LGFHFTNVYKELKRGRCELLDSEYRTYTGYSAHISQQDYEAKAARKGCDLKIGNDHKFAAYIEEKISQKYSPKAALDAITNEGKTFKTKISHTTLYRYIDAGVFLSITNKDLPEGKRKRTYKKVRRISYRHSLYPSISDRPKEIANRHSFGHWEMDTVCGKARGYSTCLLVLSERKTRSEILIKLKRKTAANVVAALDRLQRKFGRYFKRIFKTITVDNGSEFDDYKGLCKRNRIQLFYCHPYSSWERGTNENINKLIRRHIPKGTPIANYSHKEVKKIEDWINNYPRQIFGGKSSNMMLMEELTAIFGQDLPSFLATKACHLFLPPFFATDFLIHSHYLLSVAKHTDKRKDAKIYHTTATQAKAPGEESLRPGLCTANLPAAIR
jgi:IS30 family transposase